MREEWRKINGYESIYEISSLGNVKSIKSGIGRMKQFTHYKGHLFIFLTKGLRRKKFFVHRLVACAFIPNPENKECVNHKDEDKKNNKVGNLEWMTSGENTRYSMPSRPKRKKCKCGGWNCSYSCVLCRSHVSIGLGEHYCKGK